MDIRHTRGIMEHKFFMKMRIEYLLNHGYLSENDYLTLAEAVYREAERAHLLALKYDMTGRQSLVSGICSCLEEMHLTEKSYLTAVLKDLTVRTGKERA